MISKIFKKIEKRFAKYVYETTYKLSEEGEFKLGYNNVKKITKTYNSLKHSRSHQARKKLYTEQFDQLLQQNGERKTSGSTVINDGWAIDKTQTLPYLDELIRASKQILTSKPANEKRINPSFDIVSEPDDLGRYPAFLKFATSSDLLSIVGNYLGCIPVLTHIEVIRSGPSHETQRNAKLQASQLFHKDQMDSRMVRVTIHLEDVNAGNGPFTFLPASVSNEAGKKLHYGDKTQTYRISDEAMYSVVPREKLISATGEAGTVLFVDASNCFHYGSRVLEKDRFVTMLTFETDVPEHFREILSGGASSNMKRFIDEKDSSLKKMVLDPHRYTL